MERATLETEDEAVYFVVQTTRHGLHIKMVDFDDDRMIDAYITKAQALDMSAALAEWAEKVDR